MELCLTLAAGAVLWLRSAGPVRLAWQHSVERFAIEEVYEATPAGVVLAEVGLRGLGAGVEVPPEARLVQGWWRFAPQRAAQPAVHFANSGQAGGYQVCAQGRCRPLPPGPPAGLSVCGPA